MALGGQELSSILMAAGAIQAFEQEGEGQVYWTKALGAQFPLPMCISASLPCGECTDGAEIGTCDR